MTYLEGINSLSEDAPTMSKTHSVPAPFPAPLYPARYGIVDAFRGCAALAVVLAHLQIGEDTSSGGTVNLHRAAFPFGYEAVLIFFVISGYCIAASAQNCLQRGFAFRDFMWRRIRRIYPPYLCAIAFWALSRYIKYRVGGEWTLDRSATDWLQNITLTQWISLLWDPINNPAGNPKLFVAAFWSLCYEEQFYIVMAGLLALSSRFPKVVLHGSIALAIAGIAWGAVFPTQKYGIFIEYWAAFATGLLAYHRLCTVESLIVRRVIDFSLLLLTVASALIAWGLQIDWGPRTPSNDAFVLSWSSLTVASAMALVLIVLRPLDVRYLAFRPLSIPLMGLAAISYSLYLTHQFCLALATGTTRRVLDFLHLPTEGPLLWTGHVVVLLIVATIFWYFCERPFLNTKRLTPSTSRELKSTQS